MIIIVGVSVVTLLFIIICYQWAVKFTVRKRKRIGKSTVTIAHSARWHFVPNNVLPVTLCITHSGPVPVVPNVIKVSALMNYWKGTMLRNTPMVSFLFFFFLWMFLYLFRIFPKPLPWTVNSFLNISEICRMNWMYNTIIMFPRIDRMLPNIASMP